ncbi:MAG: hypothetical protein ACREC7_06570 [Methyloceanibacter sp.]
MARVGARLAIDAGSVAKHPEQSLLLEEFVSGADVMNWKDASESQQGAN